MCALILNSICSRLGIRVLSLWELRREFEKEWHGVWCEKRAWSIEQWIQDYWLRDIGGSIYRVSVDPWIEKGNRFMWDLLRKYVKAVLKCLLAWIKWIIANSTIIDKLRILNLCIYIYMFWNTRRYPLTSAIRIVYFHRKCENVPPLYYAKLYCKVDNEKIFHE